MQRIAVSALAVFALLLGAGVSRASWDQMSYSGYQPWWNIFNKRYTTQTPEEQRL